MFSVVKSEKKILNSRIRTIPNLWCRAKYMQKYFLCPLDLPAKSFENAVRNQFNPLSSWQKINCEILESKFQTYELAKAAELTIVRNMEQGDAELTYSYETVMDKTFTQNSAGPKADHMAIKPAQIQTESNDLVIATQSVNAVVVVQNELIYKYAELSLGEETAPFMKMEPRGILTEPTLPKKSDGSVSQGRSQSVEQQPLLQTELNESASADPPFAHKEMEPMKEVYELPIGRKKHLKRYQAVLNSKTFLSAEATRLSDSYQTANYKEMVRMVSARVFKDSFLKDYSYCGQGKKKELRKYANVIEVIIQATLIKYPSVLRDEILDYFKKEYIKYAERREQRALTRQ